MNKEVLVKRVEKNNRVFEFRFWDEICGFVLHYAGVFEILPDKKFLFWTIPNEETIKYGWGMKDRVAWCEEVLDSVFEREIEEKKDVEKVKSFCND